MDRTPDARPALGDPAVSAGLALAAAEALYRDLCHLASRIPPASVVGTQRVLHPQAFVDGLYLDLLSRRPSRREGGRERLRLAMAVAETAAEPLAGDAE